MTKTLSFFLLAGVLAAPSAAVADAGRIKHVTGPAHIERGGERIPARADATVRAQDTVVTGPNATVGITFADDSRAGVGPNSTFVVSEYAFDRTTHAGVMDATLKRGTLAMVSGRMAKQSPDAMKVRTPTVVLGVRGTEFVVYAE